MPLYGSRSTSRGRVSPTESARRSRTETLRSGRQTRSATLPLRRRERLRQGCGGEQNEDAEERHAAKQIAPCKALNHEQRHAGRGGGICGMSKPAALATKKKRNARPGPRPRWVRTRPRDWQAFGERRRTGRDIAGRFPAATQGEQVQSGLGVARRVERQRHGRWRRSADDNLPRPVRVKPQIFENRASRRTCRTNPYPRADRSVSMSSTGAHVSYWLRSARRASSSLQARISATLIVSRSLRSVLSFLSCSHASRFEPPVPR